MKDLVGIISYGVYVPQCRITVEEIWSMWCHSTRPTSIRALMGLAERAVNRWDEDTNVMATEAAKAALEMASLSPKKIGAIYLGTATNPYSTKASGTIVAEGIGAGVELMCADVQFAGKSGTAAVQICAALVKGSYVKYGLAIGSDSLSRHVAPNDFPLEYSASAGAAAYIMANNDVIAEIENTYSYATETPEFFRLDGDRYIKRGHGEGVDKVGYLNHTKTAVNNAMERFNCQPEDFSYVIFSQPNGRLPLTIARELGFTQRQTEKGLLASQIGDCGSASPLIGLAAVLDEAKEDQRILLASYGYGAGCDVFSLRTTNLLKKTRERRKNHRSLKDQIKDKILIDYKTYINMERKLIQEYV